MTHTDKVRHLQPNRPLNCGESGYPPNYAPGHDCLRICLSSLLPASQAPGLGKKRVAKPAAAFVASPLRDIVLGLVPKLLRMIGRLGTDNLSFPCELAWTFLRICCKETWNSLGIDVRSTSYVFARIGL